MPMRRCARCAAAPVPARSLGTADDVADAVLFLVSDRARYIHGQHLMVDGGVSFSLKMHLPRRAPAAKPSAGGR